jgi:hypothetical protein
MRKISIISLFFLILTGCSEDEVNIEKEKDSNIKQVEEYSKKNINQDKIYSTKKNNRIKNNEDLINIIQDNEFIKVSFDKENKNKYLINYYYDNIKQNKLLNIELEKIEVVSTLSSSLNYINFVKDIYIKNNSEKFKVSFIDNSRELNINNFSNEYNYSNITNISIFKTTKGNFLNANLTNKNFCNKNNFIYLDKNKNNELIINYDNKKKNNLKCNSENFILFKNSYTFKDHRDFKLFDNNVILKQKENDFTKKITTKYPINITYNKNDIYIEVNNQDEKNYSLSYDYDKNNKDFTIIINNIPSNWTSVKSLTLAKESFYTINNVNIKELIFNDTKGKNTIKEKDNFLLFNEDGRKYSFINNLECKYYSDKLDIIINDLESKPELSIYKGSNKKCKYLPTLKFSDDFSKYNITHNKGKYSKISQHYYDITSDEKYMYFKNKTDYNIYDYKILNNQLYLYVDRNNDDYIIVNEKINKIKTNKYININIVKTDNIKKYKDIFYKSNKVYRDYPEKLKANIQKYSIDNYNYYTVRFNSIYLYKSNEKCNNSAIVTKTKTTNVYTYEFNSKDNNCKHKTGVQVYIYKVIGNKKDIDFIDRRNNVFVNNIKSRHDKENAILLSNLKNSFIDFVFDIVFINNKRYLSLKLNDLNKNSNYEHSFEMKKENNNIIFDIKENEEYLKNEKESYYYYEYNDNIKSLTFLLKELENSVKKFNYKIGE